MRGSKENIGLVEIKRRIKSLQYKVEMLKESYDEKPSNKTLNEIMFNRRELRRMLSLKANRLKKNKRHLKVE